MILEGLAEIQSLNQPGLHRYKSHLETPIVGTILCFEGRFYCGNFCHGSENRQSASTVGTLNSKP